MSPEQTRERDEAAAFLRRQIADWERGWGPNGGVDDGAKCAVAALRYALRAVENNNPSDKGQRNGTDKIRGVQHGHEKPRGNA